jgi:hypothetical protein
MMELIERLEKATGPDRELDLAIAIAVWGRPGVLVGRQDEPGGPIHDHAYWEYTKSIDAALTLLPSDIWWLIGAGRVQANEPLYAVQLRKAGAQLDDARIAEAEHDANAAIPVCIAALKVRAALQSAEGVHK